MKFNVHFYASFGPCLKYLTTSELAAVTSSQVELAPELGQVSSLGTATGQTGQI